MLLKDRLNEDLKTAMKEKNNIKKNTIQLLRASILQEEVNSRESLTNAQVEDIIMKEKKKRIEALSQFEKANRKDLVEQAQKELSYINTYLPQPASEYEINNVIEETIKELNATQKEMGKVIKEVREKLKNKVDGKTISDKVKEKLNKNA